MKIFVLQKGIKMLSWKGLFRSHILERGWEYATDGAVADLVKTDDSISAVVRGSEYYSVKIRYSGSEITDGYCSCPYASKGEWCKHMAAVLYLVDSGMKSSEDDSSFDLVSSVQSIQEMIHDAERQEIEELLLNLVLSGQKWDKGKLLM